MHQLLVWVIGFVGNEYLLSCLFNPLITLALIIVEVISCEVYAGIFHYVWLPILLIWHLSFGIHCSFMLAYMYFSLNIVI